MATTKNRTKRTAKSQASQATNKPKTARVRRGQEPTEGAKPKRASAKSKAQTKSDGKPKKDRSHPGIISSMVEFLSAATAKSPLTKEALLDKLVDRFPKRDRTAMGRTINCQLPSRLRKEKNLNVKKNDNGYWIAT